MFEEKSVIDIYQTVRENHWRKLTNVEYAKLINYQISDLHSKKTNIQLHYYNNYLLKAILATNTNPDAQSYWLALKENLLAVSPQLADIVRLYENNTEKEKNYARNAHSSPAA